MRMNEVEWVTVLVLYSQTQKNPAYGRVPGSIHKKNCPNRGVCRWFVNDR